MPMIIVSCPKGHFFNKEKYEICPICQSPLLKVLPGGESELDLSQSRTISLLQTTTQDSTVTDHTYQTREPTVTDNTYQTRSQ